ncbi:MAG: TIGR01777 family oxidoreductase, partial [Candidatus Dormibacteraeota bacterium]|nr:TIGR01777 family oxidoreductase [Candidatus Dormibacteraeota bacterium]MBO0759658.1 TIGR01777 family oxidoreductase [Candidatus Dormibacteraeota bacterium]
MSRIVVAGGTGYIGTHLLQELAEAGHEATVLTRRPPGGTGDLPGGARAVPWDPDRPGPALVRALSGAAAVVNLAGTSIGGRPWTPRRRVAILQSRLRATKALVDAVGELDPSQRPGVLVSASGIDYYGDRGEEPVPETAPAGSSFLASVCRLWEAEAHKAEAAGLRVAVLRTGLVLSRTSPALRLWTLPFRLFVGGPAGSGRQWVSWIHLDDVVGLYRLAVEDVQVAGPVNLASPNPCRNAELAAATGRGLGRPAGLRAPAPLLRAGLDGLAD